MKHKFFSLISNSPKGFENIIPTKHDLLGDYVAIYTDTIEKATSLLEHYTERVRGVIITRSEQMFFTRLGTALWHLGVPESLILNLADITIGYLDVISQGQSAWDEHEQLKIELSQSEKIQSQLTENYNKNIQRLSTKVEELGLEMEKSRQAEQAIKIAKEHAELLYKTVPSAIFTVDRHKIVTSWNDKGAELTGYSSDEIIGKSCLVFCEAPCDEECGLYESETDKPIVGKECTIKRKDGKHRHILKNVAELKNENGVVVGGIESFEDITERKLSEQEKLEFEKQILHTQKLESLGVLAGGIAHDFNNILMGILGYADLALSELDAYAPSREFIQGINDSAKNAAGLVKQMLAYSGKGKFSLEPIDLNDLIENTIQMLNISVSKNAVLKFNLSKQPVFMEGDPSQIRQIIMNLVINASDAINKKSGVIAVTTGSLYCDREYINSTGFKSHIAHEEGPVEGMYLFLEISDTGTGMSKETISRIFEPFFTTKFTGRGLGLSAVLGIVRGHNGIVNIYSEEGQGTTFKVLFPLSETNNSINPSHANELNNGDSLKWKGTFLIADDEESIRTVGKYMIKKLGFEVLTAEDGHQAIELFKQHQDEVVCVLLDLTMPHKDGTEVFREIRKLKPGVKVILSSGYNEQDATQHFVGKGLAGFIQKPYVSADLVQKVKEVMGTESSSSRSDVE